MRAARRRPATAAEQVAPPQQQLASEHAPPQAQVLAVARRIEEAMPARSRAPGARVDDLLMGGTTKMWDHMAFIRARRQRRFMPATCRAQGVARSVQRLLPRTPFPTREQISAAVQQMHRSPPGAMIGQWVRTKRAQNERRWRLRLGLPLRAE